MPLKRPFAIRDLLIGEQKAHSVTDVKFCGHQPTPAQYRRPKVFGATGAPMQPAGDTAAFNRQQELNAYSAMAPATSPAAPVIAESKDLSGCAVPLGTYASAGALLSSVGLDKYEKVFEEEAMEPDTLIEVLTQQGKQALEEALKELGIKSMGHRLKIVNALIVQ